MKALSLHQPWGSFVALGVKTIETRSWSTDYRGHLAIHAAKSLPAYARRAACTLPLSRLLDEHDLDPYELPRGAVIATVELVDVISTHLIEGDVTPTEHALGDYSPGRFAWVLAYPHRLDEPIPYRGFQRLWDIPNEVLP